MIAQLAGSYRDVCILTCIERALANTLTVSHMRGYTGGICYLPYRLWPLVDIPQGRDLIAHEKCTPRFRTDCCAQPGNQA